MVVGECQNASTMAEVAAAIVDALASKMNAGSSWMIIIITLAILEDYLRR